MLSRTIRNNKKRNDYINKTVDDIVANNEPCKSMELIPFLRKENIDVEKLGDFLRDFYKNNSNIFVDGKSTDKINFRRLIKIYDWLKYYKNKES